MGEIKISDREDDRAAAIQCERVLDRILTETGNPRTAMCLEKSHLCGELVFAVLRKMGVLHADIEPVAFETALLQVDEEITSAGGF